MQRTKVRPPEPKLAEALVQGLCEIATGEEEQLDAVDEFFLAQIQQRRRSLHLELPDGVMHGGYGTYVAQNRTRDVRLASATAILTPFRDA